MTEFLSVYQNSRPYLLQQIQRLTRERDQARDVAIEIASQVEPCTAAYGFVEACREQHEWMNQ